MRVSFQGVAGGRSPSQSKPVSVTIPFGMASASSVSSRTRSASSPSGSYGSTLPDSHRMGPSIAFAYGSISSLWGLKRWPCPGSHAPSTRNA